ncbi:MAG TPA: MgtC/SapB family protein [Candidatus Obscuribacterales bacterium]
MNVIHPITLDSLLDIVVRLSLALLVGAVIGFEREIRHKPAGLRTHMLVSFGSAILVLIPIQLGQAEASADALSRVIQGIAAGVGFLGGGEILHQSQQESGQVRVRGLTSAAAIWVSAALGIAAGCGLLPLSLIGALMALFVLVVLKRLEPR